MPEQFTSPTGSKRATLWHEDSLALVGGTSTPTVTSAQQHCIYSYQATVAQNDKFSQGFILDAGIYTFRVLGVTVNDSGKVDWNVDGVDIVVGQDWYSAAGVNNVIKDVTSIVIASSGWHVLTGTVSDKNTSSVGYVLRLTKMAFIPAAD